MDISIKICKTEKLAKEDIAQILATYAAVYHKKGEKPTKLKDITGQFDPAKIEWALLVEKDKVFGYMGIVPKVDEKHTFISNLAIAPDYRKKGFAKYLTFKTCEYIIKTHKVDQVAGFVEAADMTLIAFYNHMGAQTMEHLLSPVVAREKKDIYFKYDFSKKGPNVVVPKCVKNVKEE